MHACNKKDIYIPDSDHPIPPFIDQIEVNASRNHITASVCVCARARACVWGGGGGGRNFESPLGIARVNWKLLAYHETSWIFT